MIALLAPLCLPALFLAACGKEAPPVTAAAPSAEAADAGYMAPPLVQSATTGPGGVTLSGQAQPKAHVRLATPQGEMVVVRADDNGAWTMPLPPSPEARVFGLSVSAHKRQAQAEGYVLVGPAGQAALLRSGAGAIRLDPGKPLRLAAVDFDRAGGAIVSGTAPADGPVIVHLDGGEAAQGRANAQGRYSISLPTPLQPGAHRLEVFSGGMSDVDEIAVSPAAPLASGPMRSQVTPGGLRIDWMTPGGGVQSTLLTP